MTEFTPQPSCADAQESHSLSVSDAKQRISNLVSTLTAWEKLNLRDSLGRILHKPIISPINVPPHNNSAMDGYAIQSADITPDSFTVQQVGIAFAGQPFNGNIQRGECIRIMTGAMMPTDCDTVIMQEQVETNGNTITIHGKHQHGQNVRSAGEDLKTGETILSEGHKITAADLGLIASLGIGEITVKRRLRVAFFSTGDELRSIGEALEEGQIYDSNRYTLYGMLKRLNVNMLDMGVVPDQKQTLKEALQQAAEQADVVITSGGVSVGEADYVKEILAELGHVDFWKIAMKPGRPLAFGKINDALFFGLPGNPVSVMVTFYQFVSAALQQLAGEPVQPKLVMQVPCVSTIKKRAGRFEFQRGILFEDEQGDLKVKTTGEQGSGILRSMSEANCFILLDENCEGISPNSTVTVQPFAGLI
ncbi:MAG: bifunctional molybdopterin-guanine dinucleotide biosynthesis adaptor protein MobB/molybdopterin molybdotransferase MoeA [Gammaproteobacteria bacterium]|nr:bifunctional molybdopterin-guanine dinucleotide biosynthesis adaptor protein MobB/molybdopterin molybdotransferase MoeA [Gammaproteobacteria bacterium]MDH5592400.1 bifunctional molybdopterin-guanine dinucleotide biosynthesis adaptor protein MobB/molybdopterin molybdotransferase MoeA [Gammaproteobacteria bacterium]